MKLPELTLSAAALIALAVPASAQQSGAADPRGIVADLAKKWQDAYNQKDAAGVAALFTNNGAYVVPDGMFEGKTAIQKQIEEQLRNGSHNVAISTTRAEPVGDVVWGVGEWSVQSRDAMPLHGFWSNLFVRDGNAWKIQLNGTILAAPTPEATGSRSSN